MGLIGSLLAIIFGMYKRNEFLKIVTSITTLDKEASLLLIRRSCFVELLLILIHSSETGSMYGHPL